MIDQEIEINEIEKEDIKATDEADPDHGKIVGVIEGKIGHTLRIIVITDFFPDFQYLINLRYCCTLFCSDILLYFRHGENSHNDYSEELRKYSEHRKKSHKKRR